jgi:hypothetical protein
MVLKALIVLVGCMGSLALAAPDITPKVALKCEFSPMLVAGVSISPMPSQPVRHLIADSLDSGDAALFP